MGEGILSLWRKHSTFLAAILFVSILCLQENVNICYVSSMTHKIMIVKGWKGGGECLDPNTGATHYAIKRLIVLYPLHPYSSKDL